MFDSIPLTRRRRTRRFMRCTLPYAHLNPSTSRFTQSSVHLVKHRAKRQKYGLAGFYYTLIGRNTLANIIDTRPSVLLSQEYFVVTDRERGGEPCYLDVRAILITKYTVENTRIESEFTIKWKRALRNVNLTCKDERLNNGRPQSFKGNVFIKLLRQEYCPSLQSV